MRSAFTGNDCTRDLVSGDVPACQAYAGDVIQSQADNADSRFAVPEVAAEPAAWVNYVSPGPGGQGRARRRRRTRTGTRTLRPWPTPR